MPLYLSDFLCFWGPQKTFCQNFFEPKKPYLTSSPKYKLDLKRSNDLHLRKSSKVAEIYFHQDLLKSEFILKQKKVLFMNVGVLLLRGVWAVKIWAFLGAEHIYTITRCLAHVTNVSTLVRAPISPLYTSERPFDQKFCYFPKEDFFWDTLYYFWVVG